MDYKKNRHFITLNNWSYLKLGYNHVWMNSIDIAENTCCESKACILKINL
nr:MAG TPA: hypothetical protein [Caudoviricetes sp.]